MLPRNFAGPVINAFHLGRPARHDHHQHRAESREEAKLQLIPGRRGREPLEHAQALPVMGNRLLIGILPGGLIARLAPGLDRLLE